MRTLLSAAFLALTLAEVSAASFDCAKASSATEKAICRNSELDALDENLSAAYKEIRGKFTQSFFKDVIQPSQRGWLKSLGQCTKTPQKGGSSISDEQCLIKAFTSRVEELKKSSVPKYDYMIFSGRVDSRESFFQGNKYFTPISKDLFHVSLTYDLDTTETRGRMSCYFKYEISSRSRNNALEFGDFFMASKKSELVSMIKKETFRKIGKPDAFALDGITEENIEERIELLEFESFDRNTFVLSTWPVNREGCALVAPFRELPTALLRPYLTSYARTQLGF